MFWHFLISIIDNFHLTRSKALSSLNLAFSLRRRNEMCERSEYLLCRSCHCVVILPSSVYPRSQVCLRPVCWQQISNTVTSLEFSDYRECKVLFHSLSDALLARFGSVEFTRFHIFVLVCVSLHVAIDTTPTSIKNFIDHFRFPGMTNCFCMQNLLKSSIRNRYHLLEVGCTLYFNKYMTSVIDASLSFQCWDSSY